MIELFRFEMDKNSNTAIYLQIADKIYKLIEDGILKPNTKLPAIRKFAKEINVNVDTIVSAYRYLENKKVVYSLMGSGTYVSEIALTKEPISILTRKYNVWEGHTEDTNTINFANSSISPTLFPVDEFKNLFNTVLDRDKGNAFSYQDSQGYAPLREAIANLIKDYRIRTGADKIQIINGAQQGIDLISKAMLTSGDYVFVEKPTYYGAVGSFLSRGAQVIEIEMENDGISLLKFETLMKVYKPKFIYVMPYFQTPTCINYSLEKKTKLLEICAKYDTYIVEEDNQSEFYYKEGSIIPVKALDYKNKVIYIKSFSKILMPGLRLGYMVLPKKILQKVLLNKYTTDNSSSGFIQRAFELYLTNNLWDKRKEYMRGIFYKRYITMVTYAQKYLNEVADFDIPDGGLNLWVRIKNGDIKDLCDKLLKHRIIVTPGEVFSTISESIPYIRLSFAAVECEDIEKGLKVLGKVLTEG